MKELSIIIVNYNVVHFLDQCLQSVYAATQNMDVEIFVVDNVSSDGSQEFVKEHHKGVTFIENSENVGFSKANNQAMHEATGKYILLLNPDTVVGEKTLERSVAFMDSHPDAGGLGIRMIDGTGTFLPESKRGLPTPWVSFYKIFGLSKFFPKSKVFGQYHLGHLSDRENQEVDVLAGAYMLMRKEALDKVGLLDETFFMYGEDIDLAYRIQLGGYKNYYLAEDEIIHYKGESTKKGSMNYVFIFYQAMIIFASKHFSKRYASAFSGLIRLGIWVRGGMAIVSRIFKRLGFPIVDAAAIYAGLRYITYYWEHNHRFVEGGEYPEMYKTYVLPAYVLLWLVSIAIAGGYRPPIKGQKIVGGLFLGTAILLTTYALSPDDYRFSRAIILLGAAWAFTSILALRFIASTIPSVSVGWISGGQRRLAIYSPKEEYEQWLQHAKQHGDPIDATVWVGPGSDWGKVDDLRQNARALDITEMVFSVSSMAYAEIISSIDDLSDLNCKFYIAHPERNWLIGSQSIHTQSKALGRTEWALSKTENRRAKRWFDIIIAGLFIVLTPFTLLIPKTRKHWAQSFAVLVGQKTWVGYENQEDLPSCKPFVIDISAEAQTPAEKIMAKKWYAQTYSVNLDWRKVFSL
ncbi:MAG: glycosyltransferase [Schleiferiaceae bacterium]